MEDAHLVKVAVLDTEVQAELVGAVLRDQGIPHILRTYRDSAYDGLFQGMRGWGHVEAAERDREAVLQVIRDMVEGVE
ncbi:MAG: hypothetical protein RI897_2221 [Verrucomicrobiota bacterium]|jgi:hypothetical protein